MTAIVSTYEWFIKKLLEKQGEPFEAVIDHGGLMWMLKKNDSGMWLLPNRVDDKGKNCIVLQGALYHTDKPVRTDMTLIEFISGKTEVQIIET